MIGKNVLTFTEIDSTNNYIRLNYSNLNNGDIVTSEVQLYGKGRGDHHWISEKGNLYFSFLLKKEFAFTDMFPLLTVISVSVIELLREYGIEARIKYPNDILVENKKICGILIETTGYQSIQSVIVGIGINVNQIDFGILNEKATSMKLRLNNETDITEILNRFIDIYNKNELIQKETIYTVYKKYSYVIGKYIHLNDEKHRIDNITLDGLLELSSEGHVKRISFNEISLEELYDDK